MTLVPGNQEIAAKYQDRIYVFDDDVNREKFLKSPEDYISKDAPLKPPPIRLLLLGARGAGKTLHGRWLAEKLQIFHISFKELLQVSFLQIDPI